MGKKSFILYDDMADPINSLSEIEAGRLFKHIFAYRNNTNGLAPLEGGTAMAFQFIKQQMERDSDKWEERAERSRKNGSKGGRPSIVTKEPRKPSGLLENPDEPSGLLDNPENPDEPRKPVNVNVNVNVNDNVNDNVNVNEDKNIVEKPVKTKAKPPQELKEQSLYQAINQTFLSRNGEQFTDYGKEGKAIYGIIKKCEQRQKENPGELAQTLIEEFYSLAYSSDKFWNSQPFLPSTLNSSGLFDRVLKQLQKKAIPELEYNSAGESLWS